MAGRLQKESADYFSHDADASSDEKIVYLESRFGHKGYAVYFKFLERMVRSKNFEIEWNDIKKAIYASEFSISVTEIEQIVTECCRKEIKAFEIDKNKLFSPGLKKRMQPLLDKREYNRLKYEEKKLKSISVTESDRNDTVKESKGKKRKEKKRLICIDFSKFFNSWNELKIVVHEKLSDAAKTKISAALKTFTESDILKAFENYSTVLKSERHYFSHKWTLANFLSRAGGLSQFVDEADPLKNFLHKKKDSEQVETAEANNDLNEWLKETKKENCNEK